MGTPARVVVVGSSNTDMIVKAQRLPAPGETVTGGAFAQAAGGKGANQAVAAARLGAAVTLVARVGADALGAQAVAGYRREGIDTRYVQRDPALHTGVALILVDARGENLIAVASGANAALSPADVAAAGEAIRGADLVMLQLETPLATNVAAAALAAEAGVPVMLDPAPAPDGPLPGELLRHVTYLTPNEHEAERLTGMRVGDAGTAGAAAARLLAGGVRCVLVTLGAAGVLVADGGEPRCLPALRVAAVDSTAAGDAFNGGVAEALGRGLPLAAAVEQGTRVAALSVTRLGAQPSLPTAEEVAAFAQTLK